MIVWPKDGWGHVDPHALAADLVSLGCVGVIPQCSDEAPVWIKNHREPLESLGLQVSSGLGRVTATAILNSLSEDCDVVLDEEDWTHVADADALTKTVLAGLPTHSTSLITDCMYPAVVSTRPDSGGHTHSTGHAAITKAFNQLCTGDRFPQCYLELPVIPDGAVARSLEWARDPSQWPSIGVPASQVRPTIQAYHRSVKDHVDLFLAESIVIVWDYFEMDASCRLGLQIVKALESKGFKSVSDFQSAHGLTSDGSPGPLTCTALGITPPTDVLWSHP